jgi:ribonucleoside-diphosphate reductase alpha chain
MSGKKKELSYEDYSELRKQGQVDGVVPDWMATAGLQMFMKKYLYQADNPRDQFERIAITLSEYAPIMLSINDKGWLMQNKQSFKDYWCNKFFNILWNGYLACSTPLLANTGTDRGLPVSCSGGIPVEDSVIGFSEAATEVAMLTKFGFGTAVDLSNIRHRGASFKGNGVAGGILPVANWMDFVTTNVSQGASRRGAVAVYLDIHHKDFYELADFLQHNPDKLNVGWKVNTKFIDKLESGNKEAHKRFARALYVKSLTGKGYFSFTDKAEALKPEAYVKNNLSVSAPQLCNEVFLHSDKDHTYTCVLAWMNLSKYGEWKDTDAVFVATVFLDCVVSYFIDQAKDVKGLEKAVRMTEKGRAIGLGAGGLHTLFQQRMVAFESPEAYMLNKEIFEYINEESLKASKALAEAEGEPEWCKGLGIRFTHRMAVAPTKSTALIYGGISEGINPDVAYSFTQSTAAGEVARVMPVLLDLIKRKGLNVEECIADVERAKGSVQHVSWLTPEEKAVFKTGFEIPQEAILRQASSRQREIDQGQSLNLFIDKRHNEEYISYIHQLAFKDPYIKGLYYLIGKREGDDTEVAVEPVSCESCQ